MGTWERLGLVTVGWLVLTATGRADANEFAVEREARLALRLLVDVRLVQPGQAPSWTDRGPGKTRYGGAFDARQ